MKQWHQTIRPRQWQNQKSLAASPPMVLAGGFFVLILLGAALLLLPWSRVGPLSVGDALFTATSAVTVTGLGVVDTATHFTYLGQGILLLLIQLGGLGFMTFGVLVLLLLAGRVSFSHQFLVKESLNQTQLSDVMRLVRHLARFVLIAEGLGIVLLALCWVPQMGWHKGLWHALFYTISAFNNAGFALSSDSLSQYVDSGPVNLIITALFMTGGIGFAVVSELAQKRSYNRLSLHSRVMLLGTLMLALGGMALFLLIEWHNPATLGHLSTGGKLWAAWFQSVTARTAGFNTIDMSAMTPAAVMLFLLLMLIGAGPGSTASGIKVTTFAVLLAATRAFLLRRPQTKLLNRAVPAVSVFKALAVTLLSLMLIFLAVFVLAISDHDKPFLDLCFEVVSAFGTVGLTRGITPELSATGKAVIMVMMFLGRVGPLTLGFLLATPRVHRVRYAEEPVAIG
ncbi:TrkH family potassium uptake protein [Gallaecimonas pentaromativorans]|uniref:Trk system potassium uptake protein TrkH n=1 Tax=Gallaecimonas pentaromativorans TaxID=584787 RepID=A0A3N1P1I1_9GAMM|nr:TrkH family potassium uptake protein [Gallaecimonas pentaromativorans]ROQ18736.1 trk system potassium uptake protein TrkH [Gallaecimonas pentaromativorans]